MLYHRNRCLEIIVLFFSFFFSIFKNVCIIFYFLRAKEENRKKKKKRSPAILILLISPFTTKLLILYMNPDGTKCCSKYFSCHPSTRKVFFCLTQIMVVGTYETLISFNSFVSDGTQSKVLSVFVLLIL